MNIKRTYRVLEIGSGNSPRERADVIADRLVHDNSQRAGSFNIIIDRPFVVCDGYNLPFKDNAFDYIICSHVFEHLENPMAFAKEIMRVAKAGYIEVPSSVGERLFGWDFHLWYCEFKNNTLIMTRKHSGERFNGFFHLLIAKTIWFRRFCEKYEDQFYIKYEWSKRIRLKINKKPKNLRRFENRVDKTAWELMRMVNWDKKEDLLFYCFWIIRRVKKKVKKIIRKFLWRFKAKDEGMKKLLQQLICPACFSPHLTLHKNILCTQCHTIYKIEKGLPIMLTKEELKKNY